MKTNVMAEKKTQFSNDELDSLLVRNNSKKEDVGATNSDRQKPVGKKQNRNVPQKPKKISGDKRRARRQQVSRPEPAPAPAPAPDLDPTPDVGIHPTQVLAMIYADHVTEVAESLPIGLKKMRLYEARKFLLDLVGINEADIYMHVSQYDHNHEGGNEAESDSNGVLDDGADIGGEIDDGSENSEEWDSEEYEDEDESLDDDCDDDGEEDLLPDFEQTE